MCAQKIYSQIFLLAILLMFLSGTVCANTSEGYKYVINLKTTLDSKAKVSQDPKYTAYKVKLRKGDKVIYRFRLGFFKSHKLAKKKLSDINKTYPEAWVDTVKEYDNKMLSEWIKRAKQSKPVTKKTAQLSRESLLLSEKESAGLMEKARQFVANKKYNSAIKTYTRVLSRGSSKFKQEALEYLGATREKNHQYAHAKAEYDEYLRLYPNSVGAERVRMRLQNMVLAAAKPRKKIPKSKLDRKTQWINYGYLSEFYRNDKITQNGVSIEKSSLTTSVGLFSRRRSHESDIKLEMTGSHLKDLDDEDDNRRRLTSMFIDYSNRPKTTSIRLGRQNHTKSGVLGRMDGVWADYQFHSQWRMNIVAGYPVNLFDTNRVNKNKKFVGYSFDIGPFYKYWDFNIFRIEQEVSGLQDREAIGGEIRYVSPQGIFFTLIDYDTYFEELNKIYVISTIHFKNRSTLNVTYDRGKSPYLLTTNALQGQQFTSIEEMRNNYSEDEIKQIAKDRTSEVTSYMFNGTIPLGKTFSLNMDLTISNISGTPDSANVVGTESTGDEYFYGTQLIGSGVLSRSDTLIVGVRFSDTHSYKRKAYTISERINWSKTWRSKFGFYTATTDKTNGAHSETTRPSLGLDYLHSKSLRFEAEMQYTETTDTGDTLPSELEGTYFSAGLIYDF